MLKRFIFAARTLALVLGLLVVIQIYTLSVEKDPLAGLEEDIVAAQKRSEKKTEAKKNPEKKTEAKKDLEKKTEAKKDLEGKTEAKKDLEGKTEAKKDTEKSADTHAVKKKKAGHTPGKEKPKDTMPEFPEKYNVIVTSGILGRKPKKKLPPPGFVGVLGKYALLRSPGGKTDLVPEGGEFDGIKVLRIGVNRVLIEYQGKQRELQIFSGMGGSPLMPEEKKGSK